VLTEVVLPKLGFSMNKGIVSEWVVADANQVTAGEHLYALESEKSVQKIDGPVSGMLTILVQVGEAHVVATVLATIK
jgi:pyruvate/2-oxoglutarate dehydrogenase complex dihydrolipoamide acyltransferase (E2) component